MPSAFGISGTGVQPPLPLTQAAAAGGILTVTDTTALPSAAPTLLQGQAGGDRVLGLQVTGDAFNRYQVDTGGVQKWGPGSSGADTVLGRTAAGVLSLSSGSLDVSGAGQGLRVGEAANGKQGTGVLVAGSLVVANTSVTANSRILLTSQADGGAPGFLRVSARTAGVSFTVTSSSGTDTSTFAYEIFEPG